MVDAWGRGPVRLQGEVPAPQNLCLRALLSGCCANPPPPPLPCGWAVFAHSGVHVAVVACCGPCSLPVTSVGRSGATLGLSRGRPGVWQRCRLLLRTVPRDTWTGGRGPQPDQLSAASPLLGPHSVCALRSPLPGQGYCGVVPAPMGALAQGQEWGASFDGLLLWRGWTQPPYRVQEPQCWQGLLGLLGAQTPC